MLRRFALVVALLPFLVAAGGRVFRNDAAKVRGFDPPVGWEQQPTGSYARLVGSWETKDGARMTLVSQKVRDGWSARGLAEESRGSLERQGFRDIKLSPAPAASDQSDRIALDATLDDGHRFVRQLYVVSSGLGYVLTMVGPLARSPQLKRDFDEAATSLSVGDSDTASPPRR